MLIRLVFLSALAWSSALSAKPACWQLISSQPLQTSATMSKMTAARLWREGFIGGRNLRGFNAFLQEQGLAEKDLEPFRLSEWMDRMVLQQWQNWAHVTPEQREAALTLELMKLSPAPEAGDVVKLSGSEQLRRLSAANKARLLAHLNQANPVVENAEIREIAESLAQSLRFNYLHPSSAARRSGESEPLVSGRELARLGLNSGGDWFSDLLQPSASVGFQIIATNAALGPRELSSLQVSEPLRLNDEFAHANGFILPRPVSAVALMHIFARWQPSALEEVLSSLRFSLPSGVNTVAALEDYLTSGRLMSLVPLERQGQVLAPLRTRLNQFIFTAADGEEFMREAFVHYLLWRANGERSNIDSLALQFGESGGVQRLLMLGFREFLGLGAMQLRVPVAVNPTDYKIVTEAADFSLQQQQQLLRALHPNSSGLDHSSKP